MEKLNSKQSVLFLRKIFRFYKKCKSFEKHHSFRYNFDRTPSGPVIRSKQYALDPGGCLEIPVPGKTRSNYLRVHILPMD